MRTKLEVLWERPDTWIPVVRYKRVDGRIWITYLSPASPDNPDQGQLTDIDYPADSPCVRPVVGQFETGRVQTGTRIA